MSQVISSKTVSNMLTVTKRTPRFDQPAGQQAALAEARAAVAVAHRGRLLVQGERLAGLRAGHQAISEIEIVVELLGLRRSSRRRPTAPSTASRIFCRRLGPDGGDVVRRQQIGHLEVRSPTDRR